MRHLLSSVLCAAAVAAACAPALGGDILQRKDGSFNPTIKSGDRPTQADFDASTYQVVGADVDKVTYTLTIGSGGSARVVSQSEASTNVMEIWIEPKKFPPAWKQALAEFESGDYRSARTNFAAVGGDSKAHPVVRQKALLFAARATREGGTSAEAEAAYAALLKEFPNSFYSAAAIKDQSQLWMDAGSPEKARAFADQLLRLPGVSASDKLEARFLQVTVDFRNAAAKKEQSGIQKALDAYKSLAQETAGKKDFAGVHQLAKVGQANCLLELGTVAEAKGIFQEISDRAQETAVCAASFNGLGDCFFREGNFVEARRCFLRTATIYAEGTPGDQVARALYHAGECFSKLQDSPDWKDRARRELSECKRRFPKSSWANLADRSLRALPK